MLFVIKTYINYINLNDLIKNLYMFFLITLICLYMFYTIKRDKLIYLSINTYIVHICFVMKNIQCVSL